VCEYRTQLKAIHVWRCQAFRLDGHSTVLVVNGYDDRMVPTSNSLDLVQRLPNAQLKLYSEAGHGGIFQYHEEFVKEVLEFLLKYYESIYHRPL